MSSRISTRLRKIITNNLTEWSKYNETDKMKQYEEHMLLALAVIGLPFKSEGPQFIYSKENRNELIVKATSPTIVFAKQLAESDPINMSQISIHQHFYDDSDPYTVDENGEKSDKALPSFVEEP